MDDLVSVIMPSYNTGKYIADAIWSVINQTYSNWELIIVDDYSTDDTGNIVKSFDDNRIRFFKNERNLGAALTRNRVIKEAKGEWLAFLDSDDLWKSDKLEKMINFMKDNGYVFAYHDYEKIDEASKPLHIYVTGPKVITQKMMYHYDYPGCLTFMYKADQMGLVQIEDIRKNNDYAILLKLCKKANCYLLGENLAWYRVRKSSISHDRLYRKIKSHYDLFRCCDNKAAPVALWYACRNMLYGIIKKMRYEIVKEERYITNRPRGGYFLNRPQYGDIRYAA